MAKETRTRTQLQRWIIWTVSSFPSDGLTILFLIYSRHHDQVFFTWNSTDEELRSLLQTLKQRYPNVLFQYNIGPSVRFLDAYIKNDGGQLHTRVFHDPNMRSYTLPYVVGHAKCQHSDWLRWALNRAICYCSSVDDFYQERLYLEMTCLVNGYSLLFVETQVDHFFQHFHGGEMRYCLNEQKYHSFRHQWFEQMEECYAESVKLPIVDSKMSTQECRLHMVESLIGDRFLCRSSETSTV